NQVARIERGVVTRRFVKALLLGGLGSLILMSLVFGVRHDLASVAQTTVFWAKLAYPLAIAVGAMLAVMRLGRPGARAGCSWAVVALRLVGVGAASMVLLDGTAPGARWAVVLGHTWRTCPFNIMLLSLPTFPAVFWAVKSLAPTQLRLAGAVAGLLA